MLPSILPVEIQINSVHIVVSVRSNNPGVKVKKVKRLSDTSFVT